MRRSLIFVGMAPNQASWAHGLAAGGAMGSKDPLDYAERYCARIALTGRVGASLSGMLGITLHQFFVGHARANLNRRFTGKVGKGDKFDRAAGDLRAAELLAEHTDFVLLGAEVARCFRIPSWAPLDVRNLGTGPDRKRFLLFPHPSGIVTWWNSPENRRLAKVRLARFVRSVRKLNEQPA